MLLVAGDLTFNGEKLSHETVAGLFEEIEAAGVPVLTLPGNHDVNNGMAYRYTGNTAEPTETVTAQEFREIYRAYGWEDSLLRDTASMSYVWEPAEDLWIIAIDGNTDSHSGWVDDETLTWLDKVLTQAEEEGKARAHLQPSESGAAQCPVPVRVHLRQCHDRPGTDGGSRREPQSLGTYPYPAYRGV